MDRDVTSAEPRSGWVAASAMVDMTAIALLPTLWSCVEPGEQAEAPARASLSADPIWAVASVDGPGRKDHLLRRRCIPVGTRDREMARADLLDLPGSAKPTNHQGLSPGSRACSGRR